VITNLENKAQQDALIARLLESPLAAELQRSLSEGGEAIRQRANQLFEERKRLNRERNARLNEKAAASRARSDEAREAYEAAKREAEMDGDKARNAQEEAARVLAELRTLKTAGDSRLDELGISSVADLERRYAK
jgi:hypothetical protein